jgi:outer membrane protein TolC
MPLRRLALVAALVAVVLCSHAALITAQDLPVVRVAIVIDGPWESNDEIREMFEQEILDIVEGEWDVRFPEDVRIVCDWTGSCVTEALDRLLADPRVDVIITLGVLASNYASTKGALSKPVIAPVVIDADIQDLPQDRGTSGVKNLNYIVFPNNVLRDMKTFLEIVTFKKVAFFVNANIRDNIPVLTERTSAILAELELEPQLIPIADSVDEAFAQMAPGTEAVYVAPLLHLSSEEWQKLPAGLIERKLPSFSLYGRSDVERGLLSCVAGDIFPRMSRRVAVNFQRIMLGEEPGLIPTAFDAREQLTINVATARAIGVNPSWGVLTDATLIQEERKGVPRRLTLESAVQEALDVNRGLLATERDVAAAAEDIKLAESQLWPQVDLSLLGVRINKNLAEFNPFQAEGEFSGSVSLTQILYSDPAWANLTIQKRLQRAREKEYEGVRLDIVQETATAYLDVLRLITGERIVKDNLTRTRENLELAEVRVSIGTAYRSEVLRWESQVANNKIDVIDANSLKNVAEIQLNRVLHRDEEENFTLEEANLDDPLLLFPQGELTKYIDNPWDFKLFRRFMVAEAFGSSPEILALDEAIAAQKRLVTSTGRAFWLPQFGLSAEANNVFGWNGVGSTEIEQLGTPEFSWNVAVFLSYPIFSGGARLYERHQASTTLTGLRLQLENTQDLVEQRVRSALHLAGASYAGIAQARLAADAANETLALVEESYGLGATSIVTLLDAQNNSLTADLVAATAVYDFLIEMMEVERSIGVLVIELTPEERRVFFDRLDQFYADNR